MLSSIRARGLWALIGAVAALALLGCGLLRGSAPTARPATPTVAGLLATATAMATPTSSPTPIPTRAPTATSTPVPTATRTPAPTAAPAELAALDAVWNRYTNPRLGFSLKAPREAASLWGGCAYSDKGGDHSWRPQEQTVPVKAFEDGDSVYFAFEHSYRLTGETKEGGRSFFSGCERQTTTLDGLRQERRTWQVIARTVSGEAGVDAFLKQRFGPGCSMGEQRPTAQEGVQEIRIKGDGKDMATTQCPVNYAVVILYSAQKGRLYTWDLGQAYTFCGAGSRTCYDGDMTASFRVE